MSKTPIEEARDADLRLSMQAMQRAAQQAYELARRTGTAIVVSHRGVTETIRPNIAAPGVREATPHYGDPS